MSEQKHTQELTEAEFNMRAALIVVNYERKAELANQPTPPRKDGKPRVGGLAEARQLVADREAREREMARIDEEQQELALDLIKGGVPPEIWILYPREEEKDLLIKLWVNERVNHAQVRVEST